MKKYSMLIGAACLALSNSYGIFVSTYFQPVTPIILASSILVILLLGYIQLNKRRLLVDGCVREFNALFVLLIIIEVYFTFASFMVLVYLNQFQQRSGQVGLDLKILIVGLHTLPITQVQELTLPYYFINFLLFIYYLRCYYVMFWRQNIVFIFRYLKSYVTNLNQTLLAHLPKIKFTSDDSICALCLENYNEQQDMTKLKCEHVFHLNCVKIWVVKSNCCPLCRKKVVYY